MTLHIFSASAANTALLKECCSALRAGDALLLLGEGVRAAAASSRAARSLEALADGVAVYALDEDSEARGMKALSIRVSTLNYAGFVSLACAHPRCVSWF